MWRPDEKATDRDPRLAPGRWVVRYELLTGQKPFAGDSVATLLYKIANEAPLSPTTYNEALPAELVRIIERGMEKEAEKRCQRGQELAAELRPVIPLLRQGRPAGASS